jgi:hypothetical protein
LQAFTTVSGGLVLFFLMFYSGGVAKSSQLVIIPPSTIRSTLTDREQSSVPAVLAGMMRTDGWLERDATGVG